MLNKDGSILTAGVLGGFESSMLVAKFTTEGKLDNSFSTDGSILLNTESLQSKAVNIVLQDDNKIIVTGSAFDNLKINKEVLVLWRLIDNGTIDSTFGSNGQTTTDFGKEYGEQPFASFLYNGKIITSGVTGNSIDGKIATLLARYNNDDLSKKQIIITKIKRWLQHHNGFTWENNNNVNSYGVQRSYDGIHFSSLTKINAGNSSNTYADPSPLTGNNYYRLQTTSTNGAVNYSNVLAVTADEDVIKISPNPATNNLQIQGLLSSNKVKLTVVDFSGNTKLKAVPTNNSYNLNIAALKPGNYLLKIEMNGEVITKKFVKE
ncbi:MAG: T9SS type A sorting domain-containing protein [Parafilimonas sp.]